MRVVSASCAGAAWMALVLAVVGCDSFLEYECDSRDRAWILRRRIGEDQPAPDCAAVCSNVSSGVLRACAAMLDEQPDADAAEAGADAEADAEAVGAADGGVAAERTWLFYCEVADAPGTCYRR
jgi:hypothetical protein